MRLSVKDRVVMPEILPEQGNMIEMIIVNSIKKKIEFKTKEITDFNLRQDGENLTWNDKIDTNIEVVFDEAEINLLKEQYRKFDEEKRISIRTFELFLKIKEL